MPKEEPHYFFSVGNGNRVKIFENDTIKQQQLLKEKAQRNFLLAESDRYITPDYPTEKIEEWKTYRQSLRDFDFSSYEQDQDEIIWPTKPEG